MWFRLAFPTREKQSKVNHSSDEVLRDYFLYHSSLFLFYFPAQTKQNETNEQK